MNTSKDLSISVPYAQFLQEAKARIVSAQAHVARSMNIGVIGLYWDLGKLIVEKQSLHGWGDSVVRLLAKDLTRDFQMGKSFSARNLWFMRQMYLEYSQSEESGKVKQAVSLSFQTKVKQLVSQIPWGQNIAILQKVKTFDARVWYLEATARYGWSRNVLLNQIKTNAYSRNVLEKKSHNFHSVLPPKLADSAQEALKSEYNLEFLGIRNEIQEMELESRLIERLRDFILELGYGFCFIGRQHRLVLNTKEYFIDLLFYHRYLKALIAVELKIGPFEPEYSGKMDFYLNLLNDKERAEDDNPSIGIILCAEKDDVEVEYALRTKNNPIGVASYQLQTKLPGDLKGKLPTTSQLSNAILQELHASQGKQKNHNKRTMKNTPPKRKATG